VVGPLDRHRQNGYTPAAAAAIAGPPTSVIIGRHCHKLPFQLVVRNSHHQCRPASRAQSDRDQPLRFLHRPAVDFGARHLKLARNDV